MNIRSCLSNVFRSLVIFLLVAISSSLLSSVIFGIWRFALASAFCPEGIGSVPQSEVIQLMWIGIKLDLHIGIKISGGIALLCILLWPLRKRIYTYTVAAFLAISMMTAYGNYLYYQTYGSAIDVFFFNFLYEDLDALGVTIWRDYPIVTIILSVLVVFVLGLLLLGKLFDLLSRIAFRSSLLKCSITAFLLVFAFVFCLRGGFGHDKIRAKSVLFNSISSVKVINEARGNPISLISVYYKEHRKIANVQERYKSIGDKELQKVSSHYSLEIEPNDKLRTFESKTQRNEFLSANKPNVVMIVAESLGAEMNSFNSEQLDVSKRLMSVSENSFNFNRFIAEESSTLKSLIRLLFRTGNHNISYHTQLAEKQYKTFALRPYIEQNYRTVFLTGSSCKWGNLQPILAENGVTDFICSDTILAKYPKAKNYTWGVDEKYVFAYAKELLVESQKTGVPVFILLITTSNHPPYDVLDDYPEYAIAEVPEKVYEKFNHHTRSEVSKHIGTYRFTADCIAEFLEGVKNSDEISDCTVIAYTGDHNIRLSVYEQSVPAIIRKGVLFSIYIPEQIKQNLNIAYNKQRVSSHKDVFPTLYENTLSEQRYIQTGCNLLSEKKCLFDFAFNEADIVDRDGKENREVPSLKEEHNIYALLLDWLFAEQINDHSHK